MTPRRSKPVRFGDLSPSMKCFHCPGRQRSRGTPPAESICLETRERLKTRDVATCPRGHFTRLTKEGKPIAPPPAKRKWVKPGDAVHWLLVRLDLKPTAGCGCKSLRAKMNRLGWLGCFIQREKLLELMRENLHILGW